jgi:hypothetical protein
MSGLGQQITKAIRIRSDGVRGMYTAFRRAERYWRDGDRRTVYRQLPAPAWSLPDARGFATFAPGTFDEIPAIVADARASLERSEREGLPATASRKRFLVPVQDPATLTLESAAMRFALREDVLNAVSRYLGVVPFLSTISVLFSDVVKGAPTSSQLHHCDGDDVTQVKVFVYCSDVDRRSGPLTILPADDSQRVRRGVAYQYRQRLTDQQVAGVVGDGREVPILGPSGTSVFVDTSRCFHYGSRVANDAPPRLVTMIQYQTPYSFMLPTPAQQTLAFRRLIEPRLSRLQRLVLGE